MQGFEPIEANTDDILKSKKTFIRSLELRILEVWSSGYKILVEVNGVEMKSKVQNLYLEEVLINMGSYW